MAELKFMLRDGTIYTKKEMELKRKKYYEAVYGSD